MSWRQNNGTSWYPRNPEKSKEDNILRQHDQRYNTTCTGIFTMLKRETKQEIGHRTRNRKTRGNMKRGINRSHHQVVKIKRKELDISN